MKFLINFLSIIVYAGILLVSAKDSNSGIPNNEQAACEHNSAQLELLKAGNENLKLRIEMMELLNEKQRQSNKAVEEKLDIIVDQQQKQYGDLKEMLGSLKDGFGDCQSNILNNNEKADLFKEFSRISGQQEIILKKLDRLGTERHPVPIQGAAEVSVDESLVAPDLNDKLYAKFYPKFLSELNSNLSILNNIDKRLEMLNDQFSKESENIKKSIDITHDLLKSLNEKEGSKIFVRTDDQKMMCIAQPYPKSCADYNSAHCSNQKCRIKNLLYGPESFMVTCDDSTDGGGWIVIQRRINGSVDFYRGWSEYKRGFGNLDGEFWIGLDKLHALTTTLAPMELLIQLTDHNDTMKYAKYSKFAIGSESDMYELKEIEGYEGNAGDSFSNHKGQQFSTKDKDNDVGDGNCAVFKKGAWWYRNCMWSNLNGMYYKTGEVPKNETGLGINWSDFHGYNYSLKFVQMMIRQKKA